VVFVRWDGGNASREGWGGSFRDVLHERGPAGLPVLQRGGQLRHDGYVCERALVRRGLGFPCRAPVVGPPCPFPFRERVGAGALERLAFR
jgi:hypothetical protein